MRPAPPKPSFALHFVPVLGAGLLAFSTFMLNAAEAPGTNSLAVFPTKSPPMVKLSETNKARIEAMRRAGEPTTLAELDKWYPTPPPDQNAWLIYSNAFAALSPAEPKTPDFLASNQKALALLHQAATRPRCRYPIDLNQGVFTALPHLTKIKSCAELLQNEAVLAAVRGQREEVTASTIVSLILARSLEEEPLIISQLTRGRVVEFAVAGLESALNHVTLSEQQIVRIAKQLQDAAAKETAATVRSMIGDRCSTLVLFQYPPQAAEIFREAQSTFDPPFDNQLGDLIEGHVRSPAGQKDLSFFLDRAEILIAAVRTPGTNSLAIGKKWNEEIMQARATNLFTMPISLATLPATAGLPAKFDTTLAYLRVAQTALAVERFRLVHANQSPASLKELVPQYLPAVPVDPFSDAPLRYRPKSPRGYTVYSLGPDQQDDGGTHKPLKVLKNAVYDLAFTVLR